MSRVRSYKLIEPFVLENGREIPLLDVAFETFGALNEDKSNVIWVCHALTANSNVLEWWPQFFGKGKLFDPEKHFIICPNSLGSCYGTTGPTTFEKCGPLLNNFPFFTTRDMANAHERLRMYLGIEEIHTLIGASLGGQQALEWAIESTTRFNNLILIATNAEHSPYGRAFNESQRLAIFSDPTYGRIDGGKNGLKIARSIALLSYRSYKGYLNTQSEDSNEVTDNYKASSYQNYQGDKLAHRFDAHSYVALSKAMDSHNVGRGRESIVAALLRIKANTLVVGISTDQLFPPSEQKRLARHIPNSNYYEVDSDYGHDGFLVASEELELVLADFIYNDFKQSKKTTFKSTTNSGELCDLDNTFKIKK
jgi:homoserine O-acetyltransferase